MSDFFDIVVVPVIAMILILGVFAGAVSGIYIIVDSNVCRSRAEIMHVEYKWTFWSSCLISVDGKFEPIEWQKSVRIR